MARICPNCKKAVPDGKPCNCVFGKPSLEGRVDRLEALVRELVEKQVKE